MKCRAGSRLPLACAVVALGLFLSGPARGQSLQDGEKALKDRYDKYRKLISELFQGKAGFNPKDHAEAVDVAAKYVTYRFDWREPPKESHWITSVFKDFENDLRQLAKYKLLTDPLGQMYAQQVRVRALEVIKGQEVKPIARLNAARVLARLTEFGQGELADALVEVLKDPAQNEGVRYYVLRGLHDLLALPPRMPPVLTKERQEKCALALLEVVGHNESFPPSVPRERVEGFKVLRREAVRALAQITSPTLGDKVRPAQALLQIVANDERVNPKPRLDERLEAAIGIARMRPGMAKDYQPDYAAYHVGLFVKDFAAAANADYGKKQSYARSRPWKVDAARLSEALGAMKNDFKDPYVAQVIGECDRILTGIEKGEQVKPGPLQIWLDAHAPAGKELFKDVPDSAVKPVAVESPDK
jgi:hypothetical protein